MPSHPASQGSGTAAPMTPAEKRQWIAMMQRPPAPDDYNTPKTGSAHLYN